MKIQESLLRTFIRESNEIEGIYKSFTSSELEAYNQLFSLREITPENLQRFITIIQPGALLRNRSGMDVRVGDFLPPKGGPEIEEQLLKILEEMYDRSRSAYECHCSYESLHPFMDGNGRSGRALIIWQLGFIPQGLSFLHWWYYQSLQYNGDRGI